MPTYIRNKYEFLVMSSMVIPLLTFMILGKRNPNSIDLSLATALGFLWPVLGTIALRGYLQYGKTLIIILVYLLILVGYVIKFLLSGGGIVYSMLINAIVSIFVVILPFIVSKTLLQKSYPGVAVALILWFTTFTYFYSMIPKWLGLATFLLSFFLTLIPIRIVLKNTGLWSGAGL